VVDIGKMISLGLTKKDGRIKLNKHKQILWKNLIMKFVTSMKTGSLIPETDFRTVDKACKPLLKRR
jgi:hypothetical protein